MDYFALIISIVPAIYLITRYSSFNWFERLTYGLLIVVGLCLGFEYTTLGLILMGVCFVFLGYLIYDLHKLKKQYKEEVANEQEEP